MLDLFRQAGVLHPAQLTESHLHAWVTGNGQTLANNTVRQRISEARTFLSWCERHGLLDAANPAADLLAPHSPLRRYQRVYGKQQAKHPARWLTRDEAFGTLVASTQDGTDTGLRDEIALRLGLLGLRAAEIAGLTWAAFAGMPTIRWTGKGHKPRTAEAGAALVQALNEYRRRYTDAIGRPVTDTDPLLCRMKPGPRSDDRPLAWGRPLAPKSIFSLVNGLAHAAGLGHVAPHDLRRTAAGILHRSTDDNGAHHFDLLDIQKVLGHADPATTMRSYLDPMDTAVYARAAAVLD
ncbi:MAG: integrase/recombinase XerC [Actinomycetota bacterium]